MNRYTSASRISFEEYSEIDECHCRKAVFKYTDVTRNISVLKCSSFGKEYIAKTKEWVDSKRPPCELFCICTGESPEFPVAVVRKTLATVVDTQEDRNKVLTDKLNILFRFAKMTTRTSTMDEINYLVRFHLGREPRKTYYFPTTTAFMKISHRESIEDYQTRIFSNPIIDLTFVKPPEIKTKCKSKSRSKSKKTHSFIETTELEEEIQSNTDGDSQGSDSEFESERGDSDYEDLTGSDAESGDEVESIAGSIVEEFEEYDDNYSDAGSDY
jgi:hypothetical protein